MLPASCEKTGDFAMVSRASVFNFFQTLTFDQKPSLQNWFWKNPPVSNGKGQTCPMAKNWLDCILNQHRQFLWTQKRTLRSCTCFACFLSTAAWHKVPPRLKPIREKSWCFPTTFAGSAWLTPAVAQQPFWAIPVSIQTWATQPPLAQSEWGNT